MMRVHFLFFGSAIQWSAGLTGSGARKINATAAAGVTVPPQLHATFCVSVDACPQQRNRC
jgi:hypothetical protein